MADNVLNTELQWSEVPTCHRKAFIDERATKTASPIPAGTDLFKWTQQPTLLDEKGRVSPWWFAAAAQDYGGWGFREFERRIANVAGLPQEFVRAVGAVCPGWNELTHLKRIRLVAPVHGWYGQTSSQPYADHKSEPKLHAATKNVWWIGGVPQLYIPNMTGKHAIEIP